MAAVLKPGRASLWTEENTDQLQEAVDRIFNASREQIGSLGFSFTIADPRLPDCPLIGCSRGFCELCGYGIDDIVGQNCRFLVDPVPRELVSMKVRKCARDFCAAVRDRREYHIPESDLEPWMPQGRHGDDGVFCVQTNSRKDGSLFNCLFYMRMVELNDLPYVIALQTEVGSGPIVGKGISVEACHAACRLLDRNMTAVERLLAGMFWVTGPMRRQEDEDMDDGFQP